MIQGFKAAGKKRDLKTRGTFDQDEDGGSNAAGELQAPEMWPDHSRSGRAASLLIHVSVPVKPPVP